VGQGSEGGEFIKGVDPTVATTSFLNMIKLRNIPIRHLTEARLGMEKVVLDFVLDRITKENFNLFKKNIESGK
jgi:hypothetical protein